ncbi:MAG: hypothetical protein ABI658_10245 [Acidimicrobiales bacterium]
METLRTIGHLALHYGPGDQQGARRLLELCGCTLLDNGPSPGSDGFCTVMVDDTTATHAENIMFLSPVGQAQLDLEAAIAKGLRIGAADEDPAAANFKQFKYDKPESSAHIGIRYASFEALEDTVLALEKAAKPGGELAGRLEITKFKARPGLDPEVDRRIASSPIFTGDELPAFAKWWVQIFVRTNLFAHGLLTFGQTIELDYVFEPFFSHLPPKFG